MANLYKRGKKWAYRVYVGKNAVTNKDKYISKSGFIDRKSAKLAADVIERQIYNGEYIEPSTIRLSALSDEWLRHYSIEVKPSTAKIRSQALKKFNTYMGDIPIQKVTVNRYQQFIDDMARQHSINHVKILHATTRMLFKYAARQKLIKHSPADNVSMPRPQETVEELENAAITDNFMEKDELKIFLQTAQHNGLDNDFVMFTLLAYTGLRVGECRALKWSDINFTEHTLRVTKTAYNEASNRKRFELVTPKTKKSRRTINIDPMVIDLLKAHQVTQNDLKAHNGMLYNDYGFIFASGDGYPLTAPLINDRMRRLLQLAGINKKLSSHSFRYTHTSLLIEADVHIKEIQDRLGHSSIQTTMDIYAQLTKDVKKDASEKFSQLMKGVSKSLDSK